MESKFSKYDVPRATKHPYSNLILSFNESDFNDDLSSTINSMTYLNNSLFILGSNGTSQEAIYYRTGFHTFNGSGYFTNDDTYPPVGADTRIYEFKSEKFSVSLNESFPPSYPENPSIFDGNNTKIESQSINYSRYSINVTKFQENITYNTNNSQIYIDFVCELDKSVNDDITFDIYLIKDRGHGLDNPKKLNWIDIKTDDKKLPYLDINVDAVVNDGNYTFLANATIGGLDDIEYTKIFEFYITSCNIPHCKE